MNSTEYTDYLKENNFRFMVGIGFIDVFDKYGVILTANDYGTISFDTRPFLVDDPKTMDLIAKTFAYVGRKGVK